MKIPKNLICPLCRTPLTAEGASLFCTGARRHCYDISSSGYVNLLPPGKQSNKKTGDDREMLKSRRIFLSGGYYDEISNTAAKAALSVLCDRSDIVFCDAGCGDGYHALNIEAFCRSIGINAVGIGLEASKNGAAMAAKLAKAKSSSSFFAAANIFDMPLADRSCDIVFSMFAPVPDSEAFRILKDDGVLVVCSSGSKHLFEMREIIYDEPRISPPLSRVPDGFSTAFHTSLSYTFTLESRDQISALFTMTPFYWRCPREGRERILSTERLTVSSETEYTVYKKK